MKKLLTAFTASLIIAIPSSAASFTDVDTIHPNHQAILYVQEQGIVQGYEDGSFKPNTRINRAEFTKIVMEAVFPGESVVQDCFLDVNSSDWFADYVCNAKEKGIVAGYDNGSFKPGEDINFAEAAKIINVAYSFKVTETETWFEGYVRNLDSLNAIPTTITSFNKKITRGEMAEMIYRIKANDTSKSSATYRQIAEGSVQQKTDVEAAVPLDQIVSAGHTKNGIPSIDKPTFVTANQASSFVNDQTKGILVKSGNETKFYPYNILDWHEIVNDTVGGKSLTITYDPICAASLVFERNKGDSTYDFGTSGKLYQSNLVMYDRQTDSYWSQILAKAIAGDLTGTNLVIYPSSVAKFYQVKNIQGLKVLSTNTGYTRDYQANPYSDYQSKDGILFPVTNIDDRLPDKTLMYAVNIDGKQKAYVYNDLLEVDTLQDNFNGRILRITVDPVTNEVIITDQAQKRYIGYTTFWFSWVAHNVNGSYWEL